MKNRKTNYTKLNYINQIEKFFQENRTPSEEFRLGTEMEFFVINNESGEAVTYFEDNGINDILKALAEKGWQVCERHEEHILCLLKNGDEINLEPGAQIEFSFSPRHSIEEFENGFLEICRDLLPILEKFDYSLFSLGYQPVTAIDSIPILPKKRYDHMYRYFSEQGKYAHNMMKGTASLQVSLDYKSEKDFSRKFLAAYWLMPIIYAVLDNSPFFEGDRADSWGIRSQIWANCDKDRSGLLPNKFMKAGVEFRDYAEFIINMPAIFNPYNIEQYVGEKPFFEILKSGSMSEKIIEHILSMSFTDIRAKKYLEIRMADTLPFPQALGYIALLKGLLYEEDNLKKLESFAVKTGINSIKNSRDGIPHQGINLEYTEGKTLHQWLNRLFDMAVKGLKTKEIDYLNQLKNFLKQYCPPRNAVVNKNKINSRSKNSLFVEELNYCNINRNLEGKFKYES